MAGSRNQTKSKGKHRSNKHNNNTNDDLPTNIVESNQSQRNSSSNPQSSTKSLLDQVNPDCLSNEQLENLLFKKLEGIYKEAHIRLISYGYQHNEALNAILANGHAFGDSDVVTNIVQNSLSYIKTDRVLDKATQHFGDMKMMVDYSLTRMIDLLSQKGPNLTKCKVMWCLFLSNFQLGTKNDLPFASNKDYGGDDCKRESNSVMKKFNFTPSLVCQLKKNVAKYAAAYRVNMNMVSSEPSPSTLDKFEWKESCMVERLESEPFDPKIATIRSLVDQIEEVKKHVKERKEWAQSRVIQAAEKLNSHHMKLRELRMERMKIHHQQGEDQKLGTHDEEAARVKKVTEVEDALRKANCQVDVADASVKWLEGENALIMAEMEAFKLNASESNKLCLEAGKKERKLLKKIVALEKQRNKLQEEIAEEKHKCLELQEQLTCLKKAQEDIEVSWRNELQAKDIAITQVQEQLRLKGEDEVKFKRKHEGMYRKMLVDCQRYKDDVQRLEQEISTVQLSLEHERPQGDTFATMVSDLSLSEETWSRTCWICMEKEASIVVLPCAHQFLCAGCNEDHCRNVEYRCPYCQAMILETICVYGLSS